MRKLLAIAAFTALAFSASAQAAPLYLNLHAGVATQTEVESFSIPDGTTIGAAVGTSVGPFRVEAGADRFSADVAPGFQVHALDLSASAFVDFQVTPETSVYVGAGPDYVKGEAEFIYGNYDTDGYGYHVQAGVAQRISDRVILDAGARYLSASFDDFDATQLAYTVGVRVRV